MSRNRYLRQRNSRPHGVEPGLQPEFVPETTAELNRKRVRDWLRERDEDTTVEFEDDWEAV